MEAPEKRATDEHALRTAKRENSPTDPVTLRNSGHFHREHTSKVHPSVMKNIVSHATPFNSNFTKAAASKKTLTFSSMSLERAEKFIHHL